MKSQKTYYLSRHILLLTFFSLLSLCHNSNAIKQITAQTSTQTSTNDIFNGANIATCIDNTHHKSTKNIICTRKNSIQVQEQKEWTILIYMSADNDLRPFAIRNIRQLAAIGSNKKMNILVHLDIKTNEYTKMTRRYFIENNKIIQVNDDDPLSQEMNSGDPKTLISACKWAFENYPADDYALILWNHGTGILDPVRGYVFNPANLFSFNPRINKFELNHTIGFIDLIDGNYQNKKRGICWDDTTGAYLTNEKLDFALKTITQQILKGKKISIIGYDACLMAMYEVGKLVKDYADILVGSQEVELGTGWDYSKVLAPFMTQSMTKEEFAEVIVKTFAQAYSPITNDYTQSAINLNNLSELEQVMDNIALLLTEALQQQKNNSVKKAIWLSHSRAYCTHFNEPSYIDLHHLLSNLAKNLNQFQLKNEKDEKIIVNDLKVLLEEGKRLIGKIVISNTAGKLLKKAKGLSIYFPEYKIHSSYNSALTNQWYSFLQQYLMV